MTDRVKFLRFAFRVISAINRDMDIRMTPGDILWRTAIVMFTAAKVGTSKAALIEYTSESPEFIDRVCLAARKNKVWRGNVIRSEWAGEHGDFAFLLDLMVVGKDGIVRVGDTHTKKTKAREHGKCWCGRTSDRAGLVMCAACDDSLRRSKARRKSMDKDSTAVCAQWKNIEPLYAVDPSGRRPT